MYYRQTLAKRRPVGNRYCVYSVDQWSKNRFSPLAAKLLIGSKKLGGAKMTRTSSVTMPSTVGIVGRAPAVDEKA